LVDTADLDILRKSADRIAKALKDVQEKQQKERHRLALQTAGGWLCGAFMRWDEKMEACQEEKELTSVVPVRVCVQRTRTTITTWW
jgi:hypothetical protein